MTDSTQEPHPNGTATNPPHSGGEREGGRAGADAHTGDAPDTDRLARGGAHPEQQPNGQEGSDHDETMAGDRGQTRQPQGSGMVQPDGGVNSQGANDRTDQ